MPRSYVSPVRSIRPGGAVVAVLALALGGSLVGAAPAFAATFDVTSPADSGPGSLRQAVLDANGSDGTDVIRILVPVVTLTSDPIEITEGVSITGAGKNATTINRTGALDMFQLEIPGGETSRDVAFTGITFDGSAPDSGRGISLEPASQAVSSVVLDGVRFRHFDGTEGSRAVTLEDLNGTLEVLGGSEFIDNDTIGGNSAGGALHVTVAADVTISDTTFRDNSATQGGGSFYTWQTPAVTITDSTFENNASTGNSGGAIAVGGDISISGSTFTGNTAPHGGGAMVTLDPQSIDISSSTFDGNSAASGGAIYILDVLADETVSITDTEFTANQAVGGGGANDGHGGAVAIGGEGTLPTEHHGVAHNATVTVERTSFLGNSTVQDGAFWIWDLVGSLEVVDTTFGGNTADDLHASGIHLERATTTDGIIIEQSTFDEPSTAIAVAALGASGCCSMDIVHSTIVGETGIWVGDSNAGETNIVHSIVVGRGESDVLVGNEFPFEAEWSLFAHDADPGSLTDLTGNQFGVDPQLGALADNGGPTFTLLPAASSPAVDAGDPAIAQAPAEDQRGTGFARIVGDAIDIGAVERQADAPTTQPQGPTLPATGGTVHPLLPTGAALLLALGAAAALTGARRRIP